MDYLRHYHRSRVHRSLDMDCPEHRPVQPAESGVVVEIPQVGGIHHRYERRAALPRLRAFSGRVSAP
jgi:putative transposase